jgi:hypothetical protein
MGYGAKYDPTDSTRVQFSEITNADNFDFRREFEFQQLLLRVVRVHEVKDHSSPAATAPRKGRTLIGVVTSVVGRRA